MKLTLASLLIAGLAAAAPAALAEAAPVTVSVTGIKAVSGTIQIALYDEAGFASDKAVKDASLAVTGETVTWTIDGLAPGTYGVKLYQDVDGNGKMNTNPFGLPIEPYAFSNNAKGSFGPPGFAAAAFTVGEGETVQTIKLN